MREGKTSTLINVAELLGILLIIVGLCFVCPILISGKSGWFVQNNQFIIGPIVNCTLIYAAIRFKNWYKIGLVMFMPSVCAIVLGALAFSSVYAMYMIPFIWLGNALFILGFKYLFASKKVNYILTALVSIAAKASVIFAGYNLLVLFGAIPFGSPVAEMMLVAMGLYQFITATAGTVLAYGALCLRDIKKEKI